MEHWGVHASVESEFPFLVSTTLKGGRTRKECILAFGFRVVMP